MAVIQEVKGFSHRHPGRRAAMAAALGPARPPWPAVEKAAAPAPAQPRPHPQPNPPPALAAAAGGFAAGGFAAGGLRRPRGRRRPRRRCAAGEGAPGAGGHSPLQCSWCRKAFASRTKLFQHLRSSAACVRAAEEADPGQAAELLAGRGERRCAAFRVGYLSDGESAERAVTEVLSAAGAREVELSRASGDSLRSGMRNLCLGESVLAQETSCGSGGDVVTARFLASVTGPALMAKLAGAVQRQRACSGDSVFVLDVRLLPKKAPLNAEVSCSKRTYHYVLPLRDIDPSWCPSLGSQKLADAIESLTTTGAPGPVLRKTLSKVKQTIRAAVSFLDDVPDQASKSEARVQRFAGERLLGSEERRQCRWHNFAPKELSGSLSPHRDVVRGALDRISHAETVVIRGELFLIVAIFGDHFLTQQCRRLMGSLLCIHRGWLPPDFLRTATRSDVVVDTPPAPGHLLYLHRCQFGVWARRHGGLFDVSWRERMERGGAKDLPDEPLFQDHGGGDPLEATYRWREVLHSHMAAADAGLRAREEAGGGREPSERSLAAWLRHAEASLAPKIRGQLEAAATLDAFAAGRWRAPSPPPAGGHPEAYAEVLDLLRGLVAQRRWPGTSAARGRVLRAGGGGSFSLGRPRQGQRLPGWAETFPELARAVFELERAIAPPGREPSTWVAVNHNALFSPHTDSGAGVGQSTSLIVGLGSYAGGELVVEGTKADIRYRPLEFDGWRQRHWTMPFEGERFSLVWFTPA